VSLPLRHAHSSLKSHPIRSIVGLYEESVNLVHLDVSPTSIWSFPGTLFRCDKCCLVSRRTHLKFLSFAAPFVISLLWEFFGDSIHLHKETSTGDETDATSVSQLAEHPVVTEMRLKAPHVSNDMQAPVKDNTGYDTSDAAPSPTLPALSHDRKGGTETVHTMMHDEARRFSLRKAHTEVGASLSADINV
jgi:hypothetical protein